MSAVLTTRLKRIERADELLSSLALVLMALIPALEILLRPLMGRGIENAPVLVQHLGLVLAMFGALAAERHGHLTTLAGGARVDGARPNAVLHAFANGVAALVCGMLALASWRLVASEMEVSHVLAYGLPLWWVQASMPLGFAQIGRASCRERV